MKRGKGEPKPPKPKKEKVHKPTFEELMAQQEKSMADQTITVSNEEIIEYLKSHINDKSSNIELRRLLIASPCTRKMISELVHAVFDLIADHPGSLAWGKSAIETITSEVLEPKTRIKDAFFFPSQESELKLCCYLNKAVKTMLVCVFTITNNNLADAIRDAVKRGVDVRVISDDECMKMLGSDVKLLFDEGIPVRVDLDAHAHMHNKFVVIDDYLLITGSFNWTKQAVNKNHENLIVIDDVPLCRSYTDEFNRLWTQFESSIEAHMKMPLPPHNFGHKKAEEVKAEEQVKVEEEVKADEQKPETVNPEKKPRKPRAKKTEEEKKTAPKKKAKIEEKSEEEPFDSEFE